MGNITIAIYIIHIVKWRTHTPSCHSGGTSCNYKSQTFWIWCYTNQLLQSDTPTALVIYFNRLFLPLTHSESLHQNRVDMVASMGMTRTPRNVVTWWFIPVSKSVIILVTSGIILFSPFITRVITYLVSGMNHQVVLFFACSLPLSGQIHSFLTRAERKSWLTITRLTRCWWVQIPSGKLT